MRNRPRTFRAIASFCAFPQNQKIMFFVINYTTQCIAEYVDNLQQARIYEYSIAIQWQSQKFSYYVIHVAFDRNVLSL